MSLSSGPTINTDHGGSTGTGAFNLDGGHYGSNTRSDTSSSTMAPAKKTRPPYLHAMIAGGIGGCTGDMLMHSLDTVKTRQQGAPNAIKYETLGRAYSTIFREEGFARGLYGGVTPAFFGSLPGTVIFFGTYEYSKRHLIDAGCPDSLAYLTSGFLGDLFASVVYVPSEVLKTRLQLQGRYNNPHFNSGYNYRGTFDATRTIVRQEGWTSLFHGYKATLMRDLPFSALQFAFYEQFQKWAKLYRGEGKDIGLPLEIITGGTAGGLAGVITTPLDVVKTRIQTQVRTEPEIPPPSSSSSSSSKSTSKPKKPSKPSSIQHTQAQRNIHTHPTNHAVCRPSSMAYNTATRLISTSSPSTTPAARAGAMKLETESIFIGMRLILKHEGPAGLFRGVFPRAVWTSIQSGTMLVLYQTILKQLSPPGIEIDDDF